MSTPSAAIFALWPATTFSDRGIHRNSIRMSESLKVSQRSLFLASCPFLITHPLRTQILDYSVAPLTMYSESLAMTRLLKPLSVPLPGAEGGQDGAQLGSVSRLRVPVFVGTLDFEAAVADTESSLGEDVSTTCASSSRGQNSIDEGPAGLGCPRPLSWHAPSVKRKCVVASYRCT